MESPLTFPCIFPIKVIGIASERLEAEVAAIIGRHAPSADADISMRASNKGKYLAITIRLRADSRQQLDDIYRDLTACKQVLMAL
ncbi:MAG TPA: DUF493 domain-containing protein [Gammaproteobacteria bacterium]|nr:DUF493 domain-containing protein [Gammaproteobacteria bacterium]